MKYVFFQVPSRARVISGFCQNDVNHLLLGGVGGGESVIFFKHCSQEWRGIVNDLDINPKVEFSQIRCNETLSRRKYIIQSLL